jgi:hypothetical protein
MKYCLSAAAGALALSLATLTAQAAPAGSTTDLKAAAGASSSVEKAAQRCWWSYGRRHCRYYDDGPYYYGPSIDLRFGGHRHHRHHRHHRR